jgi:hypothetical protein
MRWYIIAVLLLGSSIANAQWHYKKSVTKLGVERKTISLKNHTGNNLTILDLNNSMVLSVKMDYLNCSVQLYAAIVFVIDNETEYCIVKCDRSTGDNKVIILESDFDNSFFKDCFEESDYVVVIINDGECGESTVSFKMDRFSETYEFFKQQFKL